jgi:hypothetical protein
MAVSAHQPGFQGSCMGIAMTAYPASAGLLVYGAFDGIRNDRWLYPRWFCGWIFDYGVASYT